MSAAKAGLFEPINLDDMTIDAKEMAEVGRVLRALAEYAETKAMAMRHRLACNISLALILERNADSCYRHLPEWARW